MAEENGTQEAAGAGTTQGDPAASEAAAAAAAAAATGDPNSQQSGDVKDGSTTSEAGQADAFAELDKDTREWLEKRNAKTPAEVAKLAREQASLLGNAIRVPGENATDEERDAYLNKLGRPEAWDGYELPVPSTLPEDLPYDAERADGFKQVAHKAGLTAKQAATIHDWAVENAVGDFNASSESSKAREAEIAAAEAGKLTKRWGPLDGDTAKSNMAFADKAIRETGGDQLVDAFKKRGIISDTGQVLDENIAVAFANIGMALFKEGDVLRGDITVVGNPFEEGENNNYTKQMQIAKADPDKAKSLIRAAGKKPEDFGL